MRNQLLGVNQRLGVTPNRWPTNFFLHFSSCVLHEPLVHMMKKVQSMRKHKFAGQKTQHMCFTKRANSEEFFWEFVLDVNTLSQLLTY